MSISRTNSLSPENNYHALFSIDTPQTINVSYSLPTEDNTIVKVNPQEFAQSLGMKDWNETVLINQPLLKAEYGEEFPDQTVNKNRLDELLSRTQANADKLVISYMGKTVGWGVKANDNIKRNDIVSFYSGVQLIAKPSDTMTREQAEYCFGLDHDGMQVGFIDAKDYGNVSRFYQHLPMPKSDITLPPGQITLDDYIFNTPEDKTNIATANLLAIPYVFKQSYVVAFLSMRDIKKGEWLGFDYGEYWLNQKTHPFLFDKNGNIVTAEKYHFNNWTFRAYIDNSHQYVQAKISKQNLTHSCLVDQEYSFQNNDYEGNIHITADAFKKAYANTPNTSPYIFMDYTNAINYLHKPSVMVKNPEVKTEKASMKGGFFCSEDKQVCDELSRITKTFHSVKWNYAQKSKTAYLHHDNAEVIHQIKTYLDQQGCKTQSGRDGKTKQPLLYVMSPKVIQLRKIDSYKTQEISQANKPA